MCRYRYGGGASTNPHDKVNILDRRRKGVNENYNKVWHSNYSRFLGVFAAGTHILCKYIW